MRADSKREEFRFRGRMSGNHRPAFGFKNAWESRALKIGLAVIGLLGIVTTARLAPTNASWFRAHDPGPRPNPLSSFFTQLEASI
jgi:hypothetical protein